MTTACTYQGCGEPAPCKHGHVQLETATSRAFRLSREAAEAWLLVAQLREASRLTQAALTQALAVVEALLTRHQAAQPLREALQRSRQAMQLDLECPTIFGRCLRCQADLTNALRAIDHLLGKQGDDACMR